MTSAETLSALQQLASRVDAINSVLFGACTLRNRRAQRDASSKGLEPAVLRQLQQLGDILECRPPKQLQQPELRPLLLALYLEELPAALRLLPTTTTTTSRSMDPWALEAARGLELLLARGLVDPSEEVTTTAALAAFEQLAQLCCGRAEAQAQAAAAGGGCAGSDCWKATSQALSRAAGWLMGDAAAGNAPVLQDECLHSAAAALWEPIARQMA